MTNRPHSRTWRHHVSSAVAIVARVAWALLGPLVPGLVVLLGLVLVYTLAVNRTRH